MDTILIIQRNLKCQLTSVFQVCNLIVSSSPPDLWFYKQILLTFHLCKFTLNHPLPSLLITWISQSYISLFITQAGANEIFFPQNFSLYNRDSSLETPEKNLSVHLRKTEAHFSKISQWPRIAECLKNSKSILMELCEDTDGFSHCFWTILRMYIFLQERGWRLLSIYKNINESVYLPFSTEVSLSATSS